MKTLMTTILMMGLLTGVTGSALVAQTTPAPAAGTLGAPTGTVTPKVKKHRHHKNRKTGTPAASSTTAPNAAPVAK